jgi:hypothetical protein
VAGFRKVHDGGQVGSREQEHRVDVLVADADPEVEHGRRVPGADAAAGSEEGAAPNGLPGDDRDRCEEGIGGAHSPVVRDDDVQTLPHVPREDDDPVARGPHRCSRRGRVVDADVPRREARGRRIEVAHDATVDRRAPRSPPDRARTWRSQHEHDRTQNDQTLQKPHDTSLPTTRTIAGEAAGEVRKNRGDRTAALGQKRVLYVTRPRSGVGSDSRDRSWKIDFVWIWHTRLSVTPSTVPISASVRPS